MLRKRLEAFTRLYALPAAVVGIVLGASVSVEAATVGYYVTNPTKSDEGKVFSGNSQSWAVSPTTSVSVLGGTLWMKAGNKASADVTFSIAAGGSTLASKTLTFSDFSDQVANYKDFGFHRFAFTSPLQLAAGTQYTLAVNSAADNTESKWYMLGGKDGGDDGDHGDDDHGDHGAGGGNVPLFLDGSNNPVTPSAVPEPASLALAGVGLAAAACAARCRRMAARG